MDNNLGEKIMGNLCEGRVAIVTGAGRGIGREHALMLASQGAKVVVNDLGGDIDGSGSDLSPAQEVVNEIAEMGGEAIVNGANVADFTAAGEMIQQAVDTWGRLDILINNAGILRDRMIFSMSEDDFDSVINVHLKGTFSTVHHASVFWRETVKNGGEAFGRIINTSSPSGIYGNVGQSNYGAAKAGIAAFSVITAMELVKYGVTV
jgi:Dehydrogenases with different specificities (related to short-chain alcohol dehydrogenases)